MHTYVRTYVLAHQPKVSCDAIYYVCTCVWWDKDNFRHPPAMRAICDECMGDIIMVYAVNENLLNKIVEGGSSGGSHSWAMYIRGHLA